MASKAVKQTNSLISEKGKLGRGIKISPKSAVTIDPDGFSMDFVGPHVTVLIKIGDQVGYLVLGEDAWNNLKKGQETKTETVTEVKSKMK